MVRIRYKVSFAKGAENVSWYAKAVAKMKTRPAMDPTSWAFQGAIHGYAPGTNPWPSLVNPPRPGEPNWNECQHQTWFFLPWHRGYLACFEAIVAAAVKELGGPSDWALPYWDYSSGAPNARKMPRAFLDGGSSNPLWAPRRRQWDTDPNFELNAGYVDTGPALGNGTFPSGGMGVPAGFGGPVTDFMHYGVRAGYSSGALENQPHNLVHDNISGWMGNPDTAALDPIFWLHHANIDRLWEVWVQRWGAGANPGQPRWRSGTTFRLFEAGGNRYTFNANDMIDTRAILGGYEYDDPAPKGVLRKAMDIVAAATESAMAGDEERKAQLVGASAPGIRLTGASVRTTVRLDAPALRLPSALESASAEAPDRRLYLNVENVTGLANGTVYRVMVRAPGASEAVHAGYISAFGSGPRGHGEAGGSSTALDVTEAVSGGPSSLLETAAAGPAELEVLFERDLEPNEPEENRSLLESAPAQTLAEIGRVSLYSN
jgi:tyrosinase